MHRILYAMGFYNSGVFVELGRDAPTNEDKSALDRYCDKMDQTLKNMAGVILAVVFITAPRPILI